MSYLLDRKTKQKKYSRVAAVVAVLIILFFFHTRIFNSLSLVMHTVFRPVLVVGNNLGDRMRSIGGYFTFKSSLMSENDRLLAELQEMSARVTNYNVVLDENNKLKADLERRSEASRSEKMVLSAILSKPNQSPYDTIIIDIGTNKNISVGDVVFALGGVPIGKIDSVFPFSSKVVLFSNSGQKTEAIVTDKDMYMSLVGRGGGNFEMVLPRDSTIKEGDVATLPGLVPHVVAVVGSIISDPRESFVKALLYSPVNIQEIKFVEVEKQK